MTTVVLCNIVLAGFVLATIVGGLVATILTQEPHHTQTRGSTIHERVPTPVVAAPEPARA